MKKYLLYLLIVPIVYLTGCGNDDEPEPTHEVGVWELQGYLLANLPTGFEGYEGVQLGIDALTFGGVAFDSYTLELKIDGSYEREIEVGLADDVDTGTWSLDDDELTLDSDEFGEDTWEVVDNEDDDFWISQPINLGLFPDEVTQEQLDSLTEEEVEALVQQVTLDLVYAFDRKD